jgi:hypothetical protein
LAARSPNGRTLASKNHLLRPSTLVILQRVHRTGEHSLNLPAATNTGLVMQRVCRTGKHIKESHKKRPAATNNVNHAANSPYWQKLNCKSVKNCSQNATKWHKITSGWSYMQSQRARIPLLAISHVTVKSHAVEAF